MKRKHGPVAMAAGVTAADTALTLPFWSQESNPVALALGPARWAVLKTSLVASLAVVWYLGSVHESEAGVWTALTYGSVVAGVVVANATHLAGAAPAASNAVLLVSSAAALEASTRCWARRYPQETIFGETNGAVTETLVLVQGGLFLAFLITVTGIAVIASHLADMGKDS